MAAPRKPKLEAVPADEVDDTAERRVAIRAARKREDHAASRIVAAEEAAASWTPPTEGGSLDELLRQPRTTPDYKVDRLLGHGHNLGIAAQYKVGKTTTALMLAACLVDGKAFLDRDTYLPAGTTVAWFNGEMDGDDWNDAARPLDILNADALAVLHLRGYSMPIMNDNVAEWTSKYLRNANASVWIMDSWRVLCAWNGMNENDNNDVGQLTARIDEIKRDAGVDAFVTLVHTPRAQQDEGTERARGAAAFDDWLDARWVLTKDQGTRFMQAEGRHRVELWTTALEFNPATYAVTLGTGGKRDMRELRDVEDAVTWVTANPGHNTEAVSLGTGHRARSSGDTSRALHTAELAGRVYHHHVATNAKTRLWYPGARPDDDPCTCGLKLKASIG
jgi:AAA domain